MDIKQHVVRVCLQQLTFVLTLLMNFALFNSTLLVGCLARKKLRDDVMLTYQSGVKCI